MFRTFIISNVSFVFFVKAAVYRHAKTGNFAKGLYLSIRTLTSSIYSCTDIVYSHPFSVSLLESVFVVSSTIA